MLRALITTALLLPLLPAAALASDCVESQDGAQVCIHRVRSSTTNPALNLADFSVDGSETFTRIVDCRNYRFYTPSLGTWNSFRSGSIIERVCTEWITP